MGEGQGCEEVGGVREAGSAQSGGEGNTHPGTCTSMHTHLQICRVSSNRTDRLRVGLIAAAFSHDSLTNTHPLNHALPPSL